MPGDEARPPNQGAEEITERLRRRIAWILPGFALLFLAVGAGARLAAGPRAAATVWMAGLVVTGLPVAWRTLRDAARGRLAVDVIAMLAIGAAILLREPLAGLLVVLMQTGGEALERHAEGRASTAVRELEEWAPRQAHRVVGDEVVDIAVEAIAIGDELLVRPGELIPSDAVVLAGRSHVDTSRLTGEPVPVTATAGTRLVSGCHNLEGPLRIRATARASESQYARIVELVRTAQASKAPLQRLADRSAVWFTPFTLAVCAVAYLLSHDPVRVLAVLVVATPCPLILATPVAVVGGINRAARRGILFRHGGAIEQVGRIDVAIFDKTGTLTIGRPRVARVTATPLFSPNEVLRQAAAVEQGSSHLLARSLVDEAEARGLSIPPARDVGEAAGAGVTGTVGDTTVVIGGWDYVSAAGPVIAADLLPLREEAAHGLRAYVTIGGRGAGVIAFADELRPNLPALFASLRESGVRRTLLLSGDDHANAQLVADQVGIDEARGNLLPADKAAVVRRLVDAGERVLMVGDGTNDAPALSTATVGIAMASGGGGIAAESADAVLLVDEPARIGEAIAIGARTLRIAKQSIRVGLGLSAIGIAVAALGYLPPTLGALFQEAIDVAVILNALRAAGPGGPLPATPSGAAPWP